MSARPHVLYDTAERPLVEVLVDDTWHAAMLRQWVRYDDAEPPGWYGNVAWSNDDGTRLHRVHADRVRLSA